jgi:hypothetical protein
MQRRPAWLAAGLIVLASSSACGGGGAEPVGFDTYCDTYARIACDFAQRCDCLAGATVEICRTVMGNECANDVEAPVNDGSRTYDDAAAGDCLAWYRSMLSTCTLGDLEGGEACDRMLVGTHPENGSCDESGDCLPGLDCYHGRCARMPTAGEACLDGTTCAEDLFCADDERCTAYRGQGGPCPEGDLACADGMYCDNRTTTCELLLPNGEDCRHDNAACADDLYCSIVNGVCQPYPSAGGDCGDSSGACADGFWCEDASRTCQAVLPDGAVCTDDEQCLSESCPTGTCAPAPDDSCPIF